MPENLREPIATPAAASGIVEPLLGVHSAKGADWVADAASTAAERLGALYSLVYLSNAAGQLVGQRPASSERMRALVKVHQALKTDLTTFKFDPKECAASISALESGSAVTVSKLAEALPIRGEAKVLETAQRHLGIEEVWLAPLQWGGERLGLLVLFMHADPPGSLSQAELLGRHIAVALGNLREKDTNRKQGEIDVVRWVYDERRFLEELGQEIRRAQRHDRPLSIVLLRVLNLSELKDRYGRFLAEQVLHQMSRRLTEAMRDTDFLGAYREDGFAAILVEADKEGAALARKRLLECVETTTLLEADLPDLKIELATATATQPEDGETAEQLTAISERRLEKGPTLQDEVA